MKKRKIDSILERLRDIANTHKDVEMCEKLGISYGTLDNWKSRDKIPPKRLIQIAKDNNVSYEWLESGEESTTASHGVVQGTMPHYGKDTVKVPYYPEVYASAGGGAVIGELVGSEPVTLERAFVDVYFKVSPSKGLHLINVTGNSMSPTLGDGDMVFVQPLNGGGVVDGKIYVCIYENEVFIKRLNKNPIAKTITLVSDNDAHEPVPLTKEQTETLEVVGLVVGSMGRV